MGENDNREEESDVVKQARQYLKHRKRWLEMFDNRSVHPDWVSDWLQLLERKPPEDDNL